MNSPTCVSLEKHFGRRYRIGWEAAGATKSQWPAEDWPWLMEIKCRHGIIHPFGGDMLCAVVTDHPGVAGQLRRLPCVQRTRGDLVELRAYFHVDDAPAVLAIMRPYRCRQLSEAERERLRQIGVRGRFQTGRRHGAQDAPSDLGRTDAGPPDAGPSTAADGGDS